MGGWGGGGGGGGRGGGGGGYILAKARRQVTQHELGIHTLPLLVINITVGLIHDLLLDELFQAVFKSDHPNRVLPLRSRVFPLRILHIRQLVLTPH